jgi:hypothetical protein
MEGQYQGDIEQEQRVDNLRRLVLVIPRNLVEKART